jgi:hypothetical protein
MSAPEYPPARSLSAIRALLDRLDHRSPLPVSRAIVLLPRKPVQTNMFDVEPLLPLEFDTGPADNPAPAVCPACGSDQLTLVNVWDWRSEGFGECPPQEPYTRDRQPAPAWISDSSPDPHRGNRANPRRPLPPTDRLDWTWFFGCDECHARVELTLIQCGTVAFIRWGALVPGIDLPEWVEPTTADEQIQTARASLRARLDSQQ